MLLLAESISYRAISIQHTPSGLYADGGFGAKASYRETGEPKSPNPLAELTE